MPVTAVRATFCSFLLPTSPLTVVFRRSVLHHLGISARAAQVLPLQPGVAFLAANEHFLSSFDDGRHFLKSYPAVLYGVASAPSGPGLTVKARGASFRNVRLKLTV
jgi:hypothetical protein